jgi:hypothetical protein
VLSKCWSNLIIEVGGVSDCEPLGMKLLGMKLLGMKLLGMKLLGIELIGITLRNAADDVENLVLDDPKTIRRTWQGGRHGNEQS